MSGYRIPKLTLLGIALGTALFVAASPAAIAQCHSSYYGSSYCAPSYYGGYQYSYYDSWTYSPQLKCYYCQFHYKPYASYKGYVNDYCIYYPERYASKCYYYSPAAKYYYGCYDYSAKGYCLLGFNDRHATLAETPADAFGKPGALPKISAIAPQAGNGVAAPIGGADPQIQAPPGLPAVESQQNANTPGAIAPPQVNGTDLPATTTAEKPAPMSDPTPLPIGQ